MTQNKSLFYYNLLTFAAFVIAVSGLFFYVRIVLLNNQYVLGFDLKTLSPDSLGSFVDGIIGTVLSFTGVVLFFVSLQLQRKELINQREELTNHRIEFRVNNILTILFRQQEYINGLYKSDIYPALDKNFLTFLRDFTFGIRAYIPFTKDEILNMPYLEKMVPLFSKINASIFTIEKMSEGLDESEVIRIKKVFFQNIDTNAFKLAEIFYEGLFDCYYLDYVSSPEKNYGIGIELFEHILDFKEYLAAHHLEIDDYSEGMFA